MKKLLVAVTFMSSVILSCAQSANKTEPPIVQTASGSVRGVPKEMYQVSRVFLMPHRRLANIAGVRHNL